MDKYNKNNIHHNKRLSSEMIPSVLDRLYTKDIKKKTKPDNFNSNIYSNFYSFYIY